MELTKDEKNDIALYLYAGSFRMGNRVDRGRELAQKLGVLKEYQGFEESFKGFMEGKLGELFKPKGTSN